MTQRRFCVKLTNKLVNHKNGREERIFNRGINCLRNWLLAEVTSMKLVLTNGLNGGFAADAWWYM